MNRSRVYGRDLTVGQEFGLGDYTLTKDDLVEFATRWDPQGFHIDEDVADAGVYRGLIASGIQSMAIMQRLSVLGAYDEWAMIAGKEVRQMSFLRPVRPGDVLTGTITVTGIEFDDRNRALVETVSELRVGGKPVLRLEGSSYMHAAPA